MEFVKPVNICLMQVQALKGVIINFLIQTLWKTIHYYTENLIPLKIIYML